MIYRLLVAIFDILILHLNILAIPKNLLWLALVYNYKLL